MPKNRISPLIEDHAATFASLGVERGSAKRDAVRLLSHGVVDVLPVGRTAADDVLGVRASVGRPLSEGTIVRVSGRTGESTAISADAKELIPYLMLELALVGASGTWMQFASLSEDTWAQLGEAQQALGGVGAPLEHVRTALADPSLAALDDWRANPMTWADAWSTAVRAVDSDSPRHHLQNLMEAVRFFEPYDPPTASSLGPFELLAWATAMQRGADPQSLDDAALRATRLPAGHEAAYTNLVGGPVDRGLAAGEFGLCAKAGRRLATRPDLASDALASACVVASTSFATYDGTAHAQAAATLRETGDYEGAISAMLSALFWSQANHGTVNEPMVGAYRELIHEAGFESHIEVLDRLLSLAG